MTKREAKIEALRYIWQLIEYAEAVDLPGMSGDDYFKVLDEIRAIQSKILDWQTKLGDVK